MADKKEPLKETTYIVKESYRLKDGTVVYRDRVRTYMPNGRDRGRPKTTQSIIMSGVKQLSEKNKEKAKRYIEKLKEREENQ